MFSLTTCENLVGLGDMVNTEKPLISMPGDSDAPGSFLKGQVNCLEFKVDQKFGVKKVYLTVWYIDKNDPQSGEKEIELEAVQYLNGKNQSGVDVIHEIPWCTDADHTAKTGLPHIHEMYYVQLDTSFMMDGQVRMQLTAVDVSDNENTTTDIVYTVKNTPPQLEMTIPTIKDEGYENRDFSTNLSGLLPTIPAGNSLMGIATDLYGIAEGYPQIMIWPVDDDGIKDPSLMLDPDYNPGTNEDYPVSDEREWGTWRTVLDDKGNTYEHDGSLKAVMFRWTTLNLVHEGGKWRLRNQEGDQTNYPDDYFPVGRYHFKVRVKDKFGVTNYYPYRLDADTSLEGYVKNDFMAINITVTTNPRIEFVPVDNKYYNKANNFVREFSISSANGVLATDVYAQVSAGQANFGAGDGDPQYKQYITRTGGDDYSGTYSVSMPPSVFANFNASNDNMMLHVKAVDTQKGFTVASHSFVLDVDKPVVEFFNPAVLSEKLTMTPDDDTLTSIVRFMGTAVDPFSKVTKMYYRLGKTEVNAADDPNDPLSLTGWTNSGRDNPNVDKVGHAPPGGGTTNSLSNNVKFSGTLSSWRWEFAGAGGINDLYQSANVTQATGTTGNYYLEYGSDLPANVWYLPMSFKVIDSANNADVIKIKVIVDPDKDKPRVSISSPANNSLVGGEVPVNGNAKDNELIYDVLIKVTAQTDAQLGTSAAGTYNVTADKNPDKVIGSDGFVLLKKGGVDSSVPFDITLNAVDEASGIDTRGLTPPSSSQNYTRKVKVEIKARDANPDNPSVPKTHTGAEYPGVIELNFSAALPVIDQITIISLGTDGAPSTVNNTSQGTSYTGNNDIVSRRLVLRARIMDDEAIGTVSFRQEDETNYTAVTNTSYNSDWKPWVQTVAGAPAGYKDLRYLFIPLNTNAHETANGSVGEKYKNKAGNYKVEIQVKDTTLPSNFTNQHIINLQIDNYFPIAYFNGNTKAAKTVHEFYSIRGKAWDLGGDLNVGGLERVVVYFTRNNALVPLVSGQTATPVTTQRAASAPKGTPYPPVEGDTPPLVPGAQMTETTLATFPNVKNASTGAFATTNSGIVVNTNGTVGGYTQTWSGASTLIDWSVDFNSSNITDGRATLNYVVFDKQENASHYTEEVLIANNRPVITGINLGTDLDGDGNSADNPSKNLIERRDISINNTATRNSTTGFAVKSGFKVINNRLNFKMTFTGGNNLRHYKIFQATRSASAVNVVSGTIVKGNVYTIVEPGSINWLNYGAFVSASEYTGTTFVATDAYVGTPPAGATVYTYTGTTTAVATSTNVSNTTDVAITNFTSITDGVDKLFLVKVYDRTYGTTTNGGDEIEQLADVVPILITLENSDTKAPALEAAPFGKEWVLRAQLPSEENPPSKADTENLIEADVTNYNRNIVMECPNNAAHDVFYGDAACPTCSFNLVTTPPTKRKGYVQYADPIATGTASISGKVVFTGKMSDNQRITKITAAIANFANGSGTAGAEFTVAEWSTTSYNLVAVNGSANGWIFRIVDPQLTIDYGHALNWEFAWDSSLVAGVARDGVVVTFRVYDRRASQPTVSDVSKTRTNNIVPYITEVITPLSNAYKASPSAFNRSALGWYPIRETQSITINGFNLVSGTANVTVNGTSLTGVTGNKNSITGTVPATATSGPLVVTVNSITSFNNRNTNAAGRVGGAVGTGYNDEPNGLNNNILTDDRQIYVWSAGSLQNKLLTGANASRITLETPVFKMSQTGKRLLAYSNYVAQPGAVVLNNNMASIDTLGTVVENTLNRYGYVAVAVDSGNNDTHWYVGANSSTSSGRTAYNLHSRSATSYIRGTQADGGNSYGNMYPGQFKTRILANRVADTDGSDYNRILIPKIHSRATAADTSFVTVSYGDNLQGNKINLHYGTASGTAGSPLFGGDLAPAPGTNGPNGDNATNSTTATARGYDHPVAWTTNPDTPDTYQNARTLAARINEVTTATSTHKGSMYTASASIERSGNSIPVIAWYDRFAQNLLISYGNYGTTAVTPHATWQGRATVVDNGVGAHVDMAVDEDNNVHLAYYDMLNGGLYYAYIPNSGFGAYASGNANATVTGIQKFKVDTYLSAGTKIMINVRKEGTRNVPYISYLHASFAETANSIRVAWPVTSTVAAGSDANDRLTGNWEVMTVPVANVPVTDYIIANGVPKTNTGWVQPTGTNVLNAAGYTNGTGNVANSNVHKTILVGYMTDENYEGAVLKKDIWTP